MVSPCYNRPTDARALLADLGRVYTQGVDLRIVLVDNASDEPLQNIPHSGDLSIEYLRLPTNVGGAGGYNAGMARALGLRSRDVLKGVKLGNNAAAALWAGALDGGEGNASDSFATWDAEYLWLVDSDARVAPDTLAKLLAVLERRPDAVAAGASIVNPETGRVFEMGGRINRVSGRLEPAAAGSVGLPETIECDYLAACCALVRADAVRQAINVGHAGEGGGGGLFPERFLNGDDAEWFVRLSRAWGGPPRVCIAVRDAVAVHPTFDRYPTWHRYYMSRNAFGPIDALGLGRKARLKRALREVARAAQQQMMGRRDLASLHLAGLDHAARGKDTGPAPFGTINIDSFEPVSTLAGRLDALLPRLGRAQSRVLVAADLGVSPPQRAELLAALADARLERIIEEPAPGVTPRWVLGGALLRLLIGPPNRVAVVPARGRPETWLLGKVMVHVTPGGVLVKRTRRLAFAFRAAVTVLLGSLSAARIAVKGSGWGGRPPSPARPAVVFARSQGGRDARPTQGKIAEALPVGACSTSLSLDVVILTRDRFSALATTLDNLIGKHGLSPSSIIVVDNASADGTPTKLASRYPGVRLLRQADNLGVDGFNRGVGVSSADVVLILDDDARPTAGAIQAAMAELERRPELAAVTLHPRHAQTHTSEWPFAEGASGRWPVMGCANFVRRADYLGVGGYEAAFFLYRNDTDLALKLLGAGRGVGFDPAWTVDHDSPAAAPGAKKSRRWLHLATRNWVWVCRRHARGGSRPLGILTGWLWAHKHAGLRLGGHASALHGLLDGLLSTPPRVMRLEGRGENNQETRQAAEAFARLMRMRMGKKG